MPNTSVRAAAEGTPKINRRSVLGGLAVGLAAPLPAAANAAAGTAEHPDAELFRLNQEMAEAFARMNRASKACKRAGRKCDKLYPPEPLKWEEPRMPDHILEMIGNMTIRGFQIEEGTELRAWHNACDEQKAANKALWAAHRAKMGEIHRETGLDAAEDAFDARVDDVWKIGDRIFATPANTFDGMLVKLRAAEMMDLQNFSAVNDAFLSIASDIKRLAAAGEREGAV